jgi:hypothetical protein
VTYGLAKALKMSLWKYFQLTVLGAFMHGDIKEKVGSIIEIFKSYWTGTGNQSDEVNKILNDKASEDHFKSLLNFIMETRIAKVFTEYHGADRCSRNGFKY